MAVAVYRMSLGLGEEPWQRRRRECGRGRWGKRKAYVDQFEREAREFMERVAARKRAFAEWRREEADSDPEPPVESSEREGTMRYDVHVPMRGIDEWVLWSFLERLFGDDTKFNVVVSWQGSGVLGGDTNGLTAKKRSPAHLHSVAVERGDDIEVLHVLSVRCWK
jgi:hypothetical protein